MFRPSPLPSPSVRMQVSLVDAGESWRQDVLVDADPESPADEVAGALGTIRPGPLLLHGRPFGGQARVASTGLRDGSELHLAPVGTGEPGLPTDDALTGWELAVVSGPDAGARHFLIAPQVLIGRDPTVEVRLDHPSVSRQHARLTLLPGDGENSGWGIEDLGSANGTWVDGRRIDGPTRLPPGAAIELGPAVLEVRPVAPADADVHVADDGSLEFNRPPRLQPAARTPKVQVPSRPTQMESMPFPWIQAVAPLLVGGVLFAISHQVATLAFIALSPLLVLSTTLTQRRRSAARARRETERYESRLAAARQAVAEAAAKEQSAERARWPDPAATAAVVEGPGRRLWERREHDPDALVVRIGVADRPASVQLSGSEAASAGEESAVAVPTLYAMPVSVDLKTVGVLGVAGEERSTRALARWLMVQLAAWHTPRTLELCLLAPAESAGDWDWVRWLPHARSDALGGAPVRVGNDQASREQRIKELLALLDARRSAGAETSLWSPAMVVVLDGVRALRAQPGVPRLLREGPSYGIYAVGLDHDPSRLAEEGRAEVAFEPDGLTSTIRVSGRDPVDGVLIDLVAPAWAERVARKLAPVRDATGEEGGADLPSSVRFVDLVGMDLDNPEAVVSRWRAGGRTTLAPVGVSIDGTFALDLQRDGPHALVAGTTGSGKSEFLQTLVASLALANRPDAIQFVLVDYKGASAFADCAELPHTVGLVTNLDGRETQRALASLEAELHRRETCLRQLRAADVDKAWEYDPDRAGAMGLARLVLVIDEFAELVHELPDFVTGLIRIARVGRSLGVHLILATQRPAGVVTGEMRANTGLRVALRMEDPGDSLEVLESTSAAGISRATPGRAYARMGGGAQIVAFQSARVAGRRKGAAIGLPAPQVLPVPWPRLGYPVAFRAVRDEQTGRATDLHALVDVVAKAAEEAGIPPGRSPWLEPLPGVLSLDQLPLAETPESGPAPVAFGLEDRPADQAQPAAFFDLAGGTHLAVAGAARSGRSTLLRTLAASLGRSIPPDDLHIYGLDFGNGALLPLASLPHCGAIVMRSEAERMERLVQRLTDEVTRRQELMARQGFGDIAEQRAAAGPDERLPYMVLLLDRWEGFAATYPIESGSAMPAAIGRLVREGPGAGLRLVLSGDRGLLTDRIASQIEDRLVLRLNDRDDYRLANINPKVVAEDIPPGRALRADSGIEVQVAVLAGPTGVDPSGQAQGEAVRSVARLAAERWPGPRRHRPIRVDTMPATITAALMGELRAEGRCEGPRLAPDGSMWAAIGVGGDELTVREIDLAASGGFIVGGPARSGRSTALMAVARSLVERRARAVLVCPRPSPLAALSGQPGLAVLAGGVPGAGDLLEALRAASEDGPSALLVDDADTFARSEADEAARAFIRESGAGRQMAVVAAGPIEELKTELRGVIAEARRARCGLLLSPSSSFDGDLVGLRLPQSMVGRMPAGRGCLVRGGECLLVQVPVD